MKKEVKWDIDIQIPDKILRDIEKCWNIKFPDQYVNAVTYHDGAKIKVKADDGDWKEGVIPIPKWHGKYAVVSLLKLANVDTIEKTRVFITYNAFRECLPEPDKIFPFAIDGAGNVFFFDYRKNGSEPAIVFLDHQKAVAEEDLADEDLERKTLLEWLNGNLFHVCNLFDELFDLVS